MGLAYKGTHNFPSYCVLCTYICFLPKNDINKWLKCLVCLRGKLSETKNPSLFLQYFTHFQMNTSTVELFWEIFSPVRHVYFKIYFAFCIYFLKVKPRKMYYLNVMHCIKWNTFKPKIMVFRIIV